ncbi:MAG: hypothetical protein AB7U07_01200 [Thermoleophilia bacterium]
MTTTTQSPSAAPVGPVIDQGVVVVSTLVSMIDPLRYDAGT